MPRPRRTSRSTAAVTAVVATAVAVLALTGCGSAEPTRAADDPTTGQPAAPAATDTASSAPSSAATVPGGPTDPTDPGTAGTSSGPDAGCPAGRIPDGTWAGPVLMDVRGTGGKAAFTSTPGTGRLVVRVQAGKVVSGTWNVAWRSTGRAESGEAVATIELDGTITGTVKGTAARPVLPGTWRLEGSARIIKPVQAEAPIDDTGQESSTMTIGSAPCDRVSGTFVTSFSSKDAAASFTGRATWTGTPKR